MKNASTVWVFDVDGVITNPQEKRITEPEILDQITQKLQAGEPVALNTGRSLVWIIDQVINPLLEKVKDKKSLENFLIIGEKGGVWASFDQDSKLIKNKNDSLTIPPDLQEEVRNLINDHYSNVIFFDESKTTMITVEVKDGYPLDKFEEVKPKLFTDIDSILKNKNLSNVFRAVQTTLDVEIENIKAGKDFATVKIIEWLKTKGIKPKKFVAFGDSFSSDISMAQEIRKQAFPVKFVYVGKENIDTSKYPFPIHQTKEKYEKGTLEFLKSL